VLSDSASVRELAQVLLTEMQQDIDVRIDWRLQGKGDQHRGVSQGEVGMALGSLGIAIPLSAIAGAAGGFPGLAFVWIGIVLVNIAWSRR
jgi:hypothetical protein